MKKGQDIAVKFPGLYLVHHNLPGKKVETHIHASNHILFIPLQGEIGIQLGNQRLTAGPGKMVYLPKATAHAFDSNDMQGERIIALLQDSEWKKSKLGKFPPSIIPVSQLIKEILFYLLLNPKTKNAPSLNQALCQTLSEALAASSTLLDWDHLESKVSNLPLKRAIQFLCDNYTEDVSVSHIAKRSGMSERTMNRVFTTELGLSPKQVLTQYRMTRAKELLLKGNESVTEIAFAVGYRSLGQFITTFRQLTGQLPSEVARLGGKVL